MDDDPGMLYLLENMLKRVRPSAVAAIDAETALSLLKEGIHPALAITDQQLPGMQGFAVARLVRERFPKTPIILCSRCPVPCGAGAWHTKESGGVQRLVKPFDPQRPEEAVDRALQSKTGR